ncbi:MAG: hypothetical protein AWU55_3009 [Halomonadaceae bacterium T82-2]|nr:MAG: hypothetical protein AWU55_3009 [Halomonadaceae bacterium T82-2]
MTYRIHSTLHGANPCLEILDASSGSVRLAWEYPRQPAGGEATDPDLLAMERERAVHQLFCRLFLLTTEQYLKGEIASDGTLKAPGYGKRP